MIAYTTEAGFDEFAAAREQFEMLMGELRSESTRTLEHGDVESLIAREGNELLRRLMQGYLDQRAEAEEPLDGVVGADGQERRHCRTQSRALLTLFGEVTVRRPGYSDAQLDSVFPLDAALNLPPDKYSQGLRRKVGLEVANGWPIATGIIEGACRHLVKDRMDLTGARWSLEGAEAVLRLRSLRASGDFEDYMTFHRRQERQRNYVLAPKNDELKLAA